MSDNEGFPVDAPRVRRTFPRFTAILVILTLSVFATRGLTPLSSPLSCWISIFVFRHVIKSFAYKLRLRRISEGDQLPNWLALVIGILDISGPLLWVMGGYYLARVDSCDGVVFVYASILWGLQTLVLLLPCCFLSTIIFCAPCLLWAAPYIVRPNPNTIATSREVLSRIPKLKYEELMAEPPPSCPICISDFSSPDEVMQLPCKHVFHTECISEWACISQLCPVCRDNIVIAASKLEEGLDTV